MGQTRVALPQGPRSARRRERSGRKRRRVVAAALAGVLAVGTVGVGSGADPAVAETTHTPIMGAPILTADELVAFYKSKGFEAQTTEPIENIAHYFIQEGRAEGIRGDLAFAQSIHETGWFRYGGQVQPEHNNFAGIGAVDDGWTPNEFASAREGVRAQIHHLRAYADPDMIVYRHNHNPQPPLLANAPVIPTNENEARFTTFQEWRYGAAPTVEQLTGTWATDPEYHQKILPKWNDMLVHAGKHDQLVPLTGDWNGDGRDTPGWYMNGSVTLSADLSGSRVYRHYRFGRAGDLPITGDWNGDGVDTLGVVRDGRWYLQNGHRGGEADLDFKYGRVLDGDYPLAGDWDGNGIDTVGIVRDGEWHLRNQNSGGPGQIVYTYGRVRDGDIPLMGDWNRDGRDTPGIVRGREWHLRNVHRGGRADTVFKYGAVGDVPVTGDWNGDRRSTPGIVRGSEWLLRNRVSGGPAEVETTFYAR